MNSLSHYNLLKKLIPVPQAMKNTRCKGSSRERMENSRKYRHGSWQKSEAKMRWTLKQGMRAEPCTLHRQWISVISRIRSWKHSFKNTKVESYSEVALWEMIQDQAHYLLNKDHRRHKWRLQKQWILYQDDQDAQAKQRMQYLLTPRSKWRMHHHCPKNPKAECPDIWIRLPTHKWQKSWSSMEDPVVLLERNLYGHLQAGL